MSSAPARMGDAQSAGAGKAKAGAKLSRLSVASMLVFTISFFPSFFWFSFSFDEDEDEEEAPGTTIPSPKSNPIAPLSAAALSAINTLSNTIA